jgi:hypothetical protein
MLSVNATTRPAVLNCLRVIGFPIKFCGIVASEEQAFS